MLMTDGFIRNREGKIIGRFDGNWLRDGTGKLANVASSSGSTITLDATTTSQIDRDRFI